MDNAEFDDWLSSNVLPQDDITKEESKDRELGTWDEIRLFMSSTFVDTHGERDALVKSVIPEINRKMAKHFIRIVPVDLRWGVLAAESKSCFDIQKTCLNQVDKCRTDVRYTPWFLGLRTERYGWVQGEMMASEGFENPEFFNWMNQMQLGDRRVSITSLEVCHAAQRPQVLTPYPTIFFYKRVFDEQSMQKLNANKLRWIFEFEYTSEDIEDPDLKYQYCKIDKAAEYAEDRDALNKVLADQKHVIYNEYPASFETECVKITHKREGAKSFGVGHATGLGDFQDMVERDLLMAIKMNFQMKDSSDVDKYKFETIQHQNAVGFKASTFVGREALFNEAFEHCQQENDSTTLILHGEPGCGKSGLLAAVAQRCVTQLVRNGDFVFIHAVDSCPRSNILEGFLRRLHKNVRKFRRDQGENKVLSDPPESITELKNEHHSFIEESARMYPDKKFVIIVDAVNQFHESLRAWDMWWLMRETCPLNVRFVISTLNLENNTFANAIDACPSARQLEVGLMSSEDLQDMVSKTLERYNKKLTTTDDRLLGNQMEILLSKSSSPLYLIASCEALRRFGIFEKVSEYIRSLPNTISDLFSFLLDDWSIEYGKMFTEDVAGLICSSKDGLLENQINDLLRFKEEREAGEKGMLYDASFSRIYDSISSFLAAGGGGYLKFFHDQLKYTVRRRFHDAEFALATNKWMRDFFYSVIEPQLCDTPTVKPPDYYEHSLNQLVHHQINAADGDLSCLKDSLRNIHFVTERIKFGQQHLLNEEYLKCISDATDQHDIKALKDWSKFVQLYAGYIKEFPQFCYSMASNQAPSSFVTKDTKALPQTMACPGFPLDWANIPQIEDPIAVKYKSMGVDVCASSPKHDIVAVAAVSSARIFDQSSGELIHALSVTAYSVCLSDDAETLYVGDGEGKVHCYDTSSGAWKHETNTFDDQPVTWVGKGPDGYMAAGSGYGRKAICWDGHNSNSSMVLFKENCEIVKTWKTNAPGYHFCFNKKSNKLFSSHKGFVIGWNTECDGMWYNGEDKDDMGGCVYSLASHPTANMILTGDNDLNVKEWVVGGESLELKRCINLPLVSGWAFGGIWSVVYGLAGDFIFATEPHSQSIQIYNQDCKLVNTLKGHSDCLNKIACVPDSNLIVTSDREDATIAWNLPDLVNSDSSVFTQEIDEKILWCGFTLCETEFITVTDSVIRVWSSESGQVLRSQEFSGHYYSGCVLHPDSVHIGIPANMLVRWFNIQDLEEIATSEVLESEDGSISDLAISEDGSRLLVTECKNQNSEESIASVWDTSDILARIGGSVVHIKRDYGGRMFSCDVYKEKGMVGGHCGTMVFVLESGEQLFKIGNGCFFSKFLRNTAEFMVQEDSNLVRCSATDGKELCRYTAHDGTVKHAVLIKNEKQVLSCSQDGSLRIFCVDSGKCIYAFFNHRSQEFTHVAVNSDGSRVIGANTNGMLYILHPVSRTEQTETVRPEITADDVESTQAEIVEMDMPAPEFKPPSASDGSSKSKTCVLL